MDVVKKIELNPTNHENRPLKDVLITDSGIIEVETPIIIDI